jgi:hypothetical protein
MHRMRELLQSNVTFRSACVWADALVITESVLRTVHSDTARGRRLDCRQCRYLKFTVIHIVELIMLKSLKNVHLYYSE